jgi:hypothetical protein
MKPIVIVGAGIAGLYTAFVLSKKGLPVLLIEKDKMLGGRMLTEEIHPTPNKTFYIEGGAGIVRKDEDEIINLVDALNIEMRYWKPEAAIVYYDGQQSQILDFDFKKDLEWVCANSDNDKSFIDVLQSANIDEIRKYALAIGTTYSELYTANSKHVCNENDFREFLLKEPDIEYGKPVKGWKNLVDVLEKKILEYKGIIYNKSIVKEIDSNQIVFRQNNKLYAIEFSELIVTCPLHFMKNISLSKEFDKWSQLTKEMIKETNYLRVYSYFKRPLKITKNIVTNLPLQRVIPINDHLIMTVYNDGQNSNLIYKMHNNQKKLSDYIESQLKLLLGRRTVPKIKKNWSIFWNKGIASWRPSEYTPEEVLPYINHPMENVHFCGDTYSLHPGWIQGAMESSNEVLGMIFDKYKL